MYSTEKVTEPVILDKSLSSLEEIITSAAETAVCPPSQLEKKIAYKWSNKLLACLLEACSANLVTSYFYNLVFTWFYLNQNQNLFTAFSYLS